MPSFTPREEKLSTAGRQVTVYRDSTGAWYVGAPGEPDCHPMPMGAFISREAARRWAERRFPGGSWRPARSGALPAGTHLPPVIANEA